MLGVFLPTTSVSYSAPLVVPGDDNTHPQPFDRDLYYSDPENVKALIRATFPEEPETAVAVARCESSFKPDAYNPTNNSHDGGVYQVSLKYHGERLQALGLDRFDVEDNVRYARILYEENGWRDWSASNHCHHALY